METVVICLAVAHIKIVCAPGFNVFISYYVLITTGNIYLFMLNVYCQ